MTSSIDDFTTPITAEQEKDDKGVFVDEPLIDEPEIVIEVEDEKISVEEQPEEKPVIFTEGQDEKESQLSQESDVMISVTDSKSQSDLSNMSEKDDSKDLSASVTTSKNILIIRKTILQNGKEISVEEEVEEEPSTTSQPAATRSRRKVISQVPSPFGIVEEPSEDSYNKPLPKGSVEITDVTDDTAPPSSPISDERIEIHEVLECIPIDVSPSTQQVEISELESSTVCRETFETLHEVEESALDLHTESPISTIPFDESAISEETSIITEEMENIGESKPIDSEETSSESNSTAAVHSSSQPEGSPSGTTASNVDEETSAETEDVEQVMTHPNLSTLSGDSEVCEPEAADSDSISSKSRKKPKSKKSKTSTQSSFDSPEPSADYGVTTEQPTGQYIESCEDALITDSAEIASTTLTSSTEIDELDQTEDKIVESITEDVVASTTDISEPENTDPMESESTQIKSEKTAASEVEDQQNSSGEDKAIIQELTDECVEYEQTSVSELPSTVSELDQHKSVQDTVVVTPTATIEMLEIEKLDSDPVEESAPESDELNQAASKTSESDLSADISETYQTEEADGIPQTSIDEERFDKTDSEPIEEIEPSESEQLTFEVDDSETLQSEITESFVDTVDSMEPVQPSIEEDLPEKTDPDTIQESIYESTKVEQVSLPPSSESELPGDVPEMLQTETSETIPEPIVEEVYAEKTDSDPIQESAEDFVELEQDIAQETVSESVDDIVETDVITSTPLQPSTEGTETIDSDIIYYYTPQSSIGESEFLEIDSEVTEASGEKELSSPQPDLETVTEQLTEIEELEKVEMESSSTQLFVDPSAEMKEIEQAVVETNSNEPSMDSSEQIISETVDPTVETSKSKKKSKSKKSKTTPQTSVELSDDVKIEAENVVKQEVEIESSPSQHDSNAILETSQGSEEFEKVVKETETVDSPAATPKSKKKSKKKKSKTTPETSMEILESVAPETEVAEQPEVEKQPSPQPDSTSSQFAPETVEPEKAQQLLETSETAVTEVADSEICQKPKKKKKKKSKTTPQTSIDISDPVSLETSIVVDQITETDNFAQISADFVSEALPQVEEPEAVSREASLDISESSKPDASAPDASPKPKKKKKKKSKTSTQTSIETSELTTSETKDAVEPQAEAEPLTVEPESSVTPEESQVPQMDSGSLYQSFDASETSQLDPSTPDASPKPKKKKKKKSKTSTQASVEIAEPTTEEVKDTVEPQVEAEPLAVAPESSPAPEEPRVESGSLQQSFDASETSQLDPSTPDASPKPKKKKKKKSKTSTQSSIDISEVAALKSESVGNLGTETEPSTIPDPIVISEALPEVESSDVLEVQSKQLTDSSEMSLLETVDSTSDLSPKPKKKKSKTTPQASLDISETTELEPNVEKETSSQTDQNLVSELPPETVAPEVTTEVDTNIVSETSQDVEDSDQVTVEPSFCESSLQEQVDVEASEAELSIANSETTQSMSFDQDVTVLEAEDKYENHDQIPTLEESIECSDYETPTTAVVGEELAISEEESTSKEPESTFTLQKLSETVELETEVDNTEQQSFDEPETKPENFEEPIEYPSVPSIESEKDVEQSSIEMAEPVQADASAEELPTDFIAAAEKYETEPESLECDLSAEVTEETNVECIEEMERDLSESELYSDNIQECIPVCTDLEQIASQPDISELAVAVSVKSENEGNEMISATFDTPQFLSESHESDKVESDAFHKVFSENVETEEESFELAVSESPVIVSESHTTEETETDVAQSSIASDESVKTDSDAIQESVSESTEPEQYYLQTNLSDTPTDVLEMIQTEKTEIVLDTVESLQPSIENVESEETGSEITMRAETDTVEPVVMETPQPSIEMTEPEKTDSDTPEEPAPEIDEHVTLQASEFEIPDTCQNEMIETVTISTEISKPSIEDLEEQTDSVTIEESTPESAKPEQNNLLSNVSETPVDVSEISEIEVTENIEPLQQSTDEADSKMSESDHTMPIHLDSETYDSNTAESIESEQVHSQESVLEHLVDASESCQNEPVESVPSIAPVSESSAEMAELDEDCSNTIQESIHETAELEQYTIQNSEFKLQDDILETPEIETIETDATITVVAQPTTEDLPEMIDSDTVQESISASAEVKQVSLSLTDSDKDINLPESHESETFEADAVVEPENCELDTNQQSQFESDEPEQVTSQSIDCKEAENFPEISVVGEMETVLQPSIEADESEKTDSYIIQESVRESMEVEPTAFQPRDCELPATFSEETVSTEAAESMISMPQLLIEETNSENDVAPATMTLQTSIHLTEPEKTDSDTVQELTLESSDLEEIPAQEVVLELPVDVPEIPQNEIIEADGIETTVQTSIEEFEPDTIQESFPESIELEQNMLEESMSKLPVDMSDVSQSEAIEVLSLTEVTGHENDHSEINTEKQATELQELETRTSLTESVADTVQESVSETYENQYLKLEQAVLQASISATSENTSKLPQSDMVESSVTTTKSKKKSKSKKSKKSPQISIESTGSEQPESEIAHPAELDMKSQSPETIETKSEKVKSDIVVEKIPVQTTEPQKFSSVEPEEMTSEVTPHPDVILSESTKDCSKSKKSKKSRSLQQTATNPEVTDSKPKSKAEKAKKLKSETKDLSSSSSSDSNDSDSELASLKPKSKKSKKVKSTSQVPAEGTASETVEGTGSDLISTRPKYKKPKKAKPSPQTSTESTESEKLGPKSGSTEPELTQPEITESEMVSPKPKSKKNKKSKELTPQTSVENTQSENLKSTPKSLKSEPNVSTLTKKTKSRSRNKSKPSKEGSQPKSEIVEQDSETSSTNLVNETSEYQSMAETIETGEPAVQLQESAEIAQIEPQLSQLVDSQETVSETITPVDQITIETIEIQPLEAQEEPMESSEAQLEEPIVSQMTMSEPDTPIPEPVTETIQIQTSETQLEEAEIQESADQVEVIVEPLITDTFETQISEQQVNEVSEPKSSENQSLQNVELSEKTTESDVLESQPMIETVEIEKIEAELEPMGTQQLIVTATDMTLDEISSEVDDIDIVNTDDVDDISGNAQQPEIVVETKKPFSMDLNMFSQYLVEEVLKSTKSVAALAKAASPELEGETELSESDYEKVEAPESSKAVEQTESSPCAEEKSTGETESRADHDSVKAVIPPESLDQNPVDSVGNQLYPIQTQDSIDEFGSDEDFKHWEILTEEQIALSDQDSDAGLPEVTETSTIPFEEDSLQSSTNSIIEANPSEKTSSAIPLSDEPEKKSSNVTIINVAFNDPTKSEPNESQPVDKEQPDEADPSATTFTVRVPEESTTPESISFPEDKQDDVKDSKDLEPIPASLPSEATVESSPPEESLPESSVQESNDDAEVIEAAEKVLDILPGIVEQLLSAERLLAGEEEVQDTEQKEDATKLGTVMKQIVCYSSSLLSSLDENSPTLPDKNDENPIDTPLDAGKLLSRFGKKAHPRTFFSTHY